jgi:hypothetical protein
MNCSQIDIVAVKIALFVAETPPLLPIEYKVTKTNRWEENRSIMHSLSKKER